MKITVNGPFASRKAAINWPSAGMTPDDHNRWIAAFEQAIASCANRDALKQAMERGERLNLKIRILGKSRRIKQLDLHDAVAQIADELTDTLFPRPKGKSSPQVMDRHFWHLEAEKHICQSSEEQVELEIEGISREGICKPG